MNKHITVGFVLLIVLVLSATAWAGAGAGGPKALTSRFVKLGKQVVVNGTKTNVHATGNSPAYDPRARTWSGSSSAQRQVKDVVTQSFATERSLMRSDFKDKVRVRATTLAKVFDSASGELSRRSGALTADFAAAKASGATIASSGVTRIKFLGIEVKGNQATAVVDVWTWTEYTSPTTVSGKTSFRAANARQHTVTLTRQNGRWLISEDQWVFVPGTEP